MIRPSPGRSGRRREPRATGPLQRRRGKLPRDAVGLGQDVAEVVGAEARHQVIRSRPERAVATAGLAQPAQREAVDQFAPRAELPDEVVDFPRIEGEALRQDKSAGCWRRRIELGGIDAKEGGEECLHMEHRLEVLPGADVLLGKATRLASCGLRHEIGNFEGPRAFP